MDEGGPPSDEEIADQLRQANQAIADAVGALEAGLSDAVVINRCYYACFHAAQAALYSRGKTPTSHGGVLSLFGSEVILDADVSRDRGRFLNRLSELRRQADYGYESIDEDVDALVSEAEAFVERLAEFVDVDE